MVYRCYTEKKQGFDVEALKLKAELSEVLGLGNIGLRIINRYDIQGISREDYEKVKHVVLSEPQTDVCADETMQFQDYVFPVEPLPGQFDQRADSCAGCIQMLIGGSRPLVRTARIYVVTGDLTDSDRQSIGNYVLNPIECRRASMEKPETIEPGEPEPAQVPELTGFIKAEHSELSIMSERLGLAMDMDDLVFIQNYFRDTERRDPMETELRVIDTYWSDHCRHTTFTTVLDDIDIADEDVKAAYAGYLDARLEVYGQGAYTRPQTLMDMATIGTKLLKSRGLLKNLDESEEINACSVRVSAKIDGRDEDWLLMFKNETHNHPTEIEPFGGAATCIGGAIRDPLSGRAYVYQAMRVTGASDPTVPISETLPGKLPQRRLTTTAAAGYSSYGNQIGLATGLVHEVYHPGYAAKRMEVGGVVGAAPAANVVRLVPEPGDAVILLGGRTGRDGIGGATGSSKQQNMESLTESAAEVQKGNAPEERKIQRLFRKPHVSRMIKRCNDFGAGGVSVAIGELAQGLDIDLDCIRKKYDGLGGTELAISESQERMAVVVSPENADEFIKEAELENLEAYVTARVTDKGRMTMTWRGRVICDLSREFLSSNGAVKTAGASVPKLERYEGADLAGDTSVERLKNLVSDLRFCSRTGLSERFDSSVGAASVLAPFSGRFQKTPAQAMAALLPAESGGSETCSVMSFGFDPYHGEKNPYTASIDAVVLSAARLVASGCAIDDVYLSLQEYFERLGKEPARWGKPVSALLGALKAQTELKIAAIGGKDSMSGSFMDMDVPPTLISFAVAPCCAGDVISPEFKNAGSYVSLFMPGDTLSGTREMFRQFHKTCGIKSAWAVTEGGAIEGIFKMSIGNGIGFAADSELCESLLFENLCGGIVAESDEIIPGTVLLGRTVHEPVIKIGGGLAGLCELTELWQAPLESVFPTKAVQEGTAPMLSYEKPNVLVASEHFAKPLAVIPVFPGTNCEYDTARAVTRGGGAAETVIIRNLTPELLTQSVAELRSAVSRAQMVILPGGFSGGDEPDGCAKFIVSLFRNPGITDAVHELLGNRDGLMLGICNGFQALVKLGLLPYGEIRQMDEGCPTLTYNTIGRHQAKYYTTRIASVNSPWLSKCRVGDLHSIAVSHGEGRFAADEKLLKSMAENGQIAAQYAGLDGVPSMDISVNPNGSVWAVEGILSPDGRILGKMGHTERWGEHVGKGIYGEKHQPIFESGIGYYK